MCSCCHIYMYIYIYICVCVSIFQTVLSPPPITFWSVECISWNFMWLFTIRGHATWVNLILSNANIIMQTYKVEVALSFLDYGPESWYGGSCFWRMWNKQIVVMWNQHLIFHVTVVSSETLELRHVKCFVEVDY
jgi:hypothetical protein